MKKILLYLSLSLFFAATAEAQSQPKNVCPTCHFGMHNGVNYDTAKSHTLMPTKIGDGSGTLGQTYLNQNVCGLNYVQASVLIETRSVAAGFNTNGTGNPTTLTIAGLPCGGSSSILQAYLYYEASYTETSPPTTTATVTNPVPATATFTSAIIGTGGQKCWGETGTAAYRADVTSAISGNGSYSVTLNGFANAGSEVDGATLIIVYKDPTATYSGSLVLYDGINTVASSLSLAQTFTGFNVCAATGTSDAFGVFADMQSNVNGGINDETFNGSSATFNNLFWNFDDIPTTLTSGQTTTTFNTYTNNPLGGDCYAWVVAGLYWQNTTCMTCNPTTTMTVATTQVNPTCGNSNGSATVTVSGGTAPYTYTWNPGGQTTATATGLSAGTYTVTVFDNSGCVPATATVTLVNTGGPTVTSTINANDNCNGGTDGSATITATGGTSPYTYLWNPSGKTTATVTNLTAGTYTVTVTDNKGCTTTTTVTISQPGALNVNTTSTSATCGKNNGTATATTTGGTGPYTYLWSPGGQTTSTATALSAGTYTVTVTDANGCNIFATATVANSSGITTSITSVTDVLCNGSSTGSATVGVSGGTLPYTYLWNPSGETTATATGLSAGTYTVTVTDSNGCSTPAIVTITQPSKVRDSISAVTYPQCNGGTGTATVGVKDGVSPYTYLWNPGGQTTASVSGLTAGTYTITVTDNNGCASTVTVSITQPVPVVVTTTTTQTTCSNNNGTATAITTGGTTPYTYLWTPGGQTGVTATGLSVGTYTITVTDNNGCTGSTTATITAITPPVVKDSLITNEKCGGGSTGSATVTVTGGTAPYTYLWNPGGYTTATVSGLTAGTYTVTVHDANGCITTTTVTITQPTPVTGSATSTGVLCNGGSTGTATVSASGGTAPYTYLWNPSGKTTATVSGLSAGTYTITITDNNGCTGTTTVTVTQPAPLTANSSNIIDPKCNGGQGSATVSASGGTAPFTYLWNPGGYTTATVSTLSAGTYTVTVTDNNGCNETVAVTITQPTAITTTVTSTKTSCGKDSGSVTVTASGGTAPYTYLWNPGGYTTATVSNLSAGTYTITVTDNNGCTATNSVNIISVSSIVPAITSQQNVKCNGEANGSATISASGGTAPYTYLWTPGGYTTASVSTLSAGTYTVLVTDSKGCNNQLVVTIGQPPPLTAPITTGNVSCNGGSNGDATANPPGGTAPYTYLWNPGGQTTATISNLSAGTYTVTVTDSNGCTVTNSIIITQPQPIVASLSSTVSACTNNGTATATVSGGTAPYTYFWTPSSQTNATATGLSAGIYTVTITDNNGCSQVDTITVHSTSTLSITITGTDDLCNGGTTGTATVTATGGTAPYTYLWNPSGQITATATGLSAGTYTAVVTDNAGCSQFATITITQPSPITLTTSTVGSGCTNNIGSATVTATGGTGAYTYLWNPGSGTTSTITGLGSGSYTITVTDANGCTATAVANVASGGVTASITSVTNVACFGNNNGSATVTVTTGTAPYTYAWNPSGQTTATATGLSAGTYTITVQDNNGCSFTATVTISGPSAPLAETNVVTNSSCNSTSNGSIALTVTGGTPVYTFNWSNGSTTQNISNLLPGSYTVTIKDANGCTYIDSMKVGFDSSVFANAGRDTILCHNATIELNGTGSVNATSYQWFSMPGMVLIKDTSIIFVTPTNDTTTYVLVVENGTCFDTSRVTIILAPIAFANAGPDQVIFGTGTVTIGGSPTGPGGSSYVWNPGMTLNDSILSNPASTPTVTTIYTVTVKNSAGCIATDTVTVFVYPGVTVPNGFTPNGDGTNDTWVLPFSGDFPNILVEVYNRWGELLFQSNGYYKPWDGTYNGKDLPVGTYYYIIKLNDPRFPNAMTGPVTIMR